MSDDKHEDSLFEWLLPVWARRKWHAVIAVAAILAASVTVAVSLPVVYQSAVTVLIERQQVPESLIKATVTGELEARLQAITQEILSRARLEALITRFDLYSRLRDRASVAELADRLRRDIGLELKAVERRERGEVTTVSFKVLFRGREPQKVADVVNALAGLYVEENVRRRQHQAAATSSASSSRRPRSGSTSRNVRSKRSRISTLAACPSSTRPTSWPSTGSAPSFASIARCR